MVSVSDMTLGLLKVVVKRKNVNSRNARSTIGVMSILVEGFFARTLPPALSDALFEDISAMTVDVLHHNAV
jgi:hypothetical protein